jgi:hypothetical protein
MATDDLDVGNLIKKVEGSNNSNTPSFTIRLYSGNNALGPLSYYFPSRKFLETMNREAPPFSYSSSSSTSSTSSSSSNISTLNHPRDLSKSNLVLHEKNGQIFESSKSDIVTKEQKKSTKRVSIAAPLPSRKGDNAHQEELYQNHHQQEQQEQQEQKEQKDNQQGHLKSVSIPGAAVISDIRWRQQKPFKYILPFRKRNASDLYDSSQSNSFQKSQPWISSKKQHFVPIEIEADVLLEPVPIASLVKHVQNRTNTHGNNNIEL